MSIYLFQLGDQLEDFYLSSKIYIDQTALDTSVRLNAIRRGNTIVFLGVSADVERLVDKMRSPAYDYSYAVNMYCSRYYYTGYNCRIYCIKNMVRSAMPIENFSPAKFAPPQLDVDDILATFHSPRSVRYFKNPLTRSIFREILKRSPEKHSDFIVHFYNIGCFLLESKPELYDIQLFKDRLFQEFENNKFMFTGDLQYYISATNMRLLDSRILPLNFNFLRTYISDVNPVTAFMRVLMDMDSVLPITTEILFADPQNGIEHLAYAMELFRCLLSEDDYFMLVDVIYATIERLPAQLVTSMTDMNYEIISPLLGIVRSHGIYSRVYCFIEAAKYIHTSSKHTKCPLIEDLEKNLSAVTMRFKYPPGF